MLETINTILYDGDFHDKWAPKIELGFRKINKGYAYKIRSLFDIAPRKWKVVGYMTNYKGKETISTITDIVQKEFPNVILKYGYEFHWGKELGTYGGSKDIYLIFKSNADEAEFIL